MQIWISVDISGIPALIRQQNIIRGIWRVSHPVCLQSHVIFPCIFYSLTLTTNQPVVSYAVLCYLSFRPHLKPLVFCLFILSFSFGFFSPWICSLLTLLPTGLVRPWNSAATWLSVFPLYSSPTDSPPSFTSWLSSRPLPIFLRSFLYSNSTLSWLIFYLTLLPPGCFPSRLFSLLTPLSPDSFLA